MGKFKKFLSLIISISLLITTIQVNAFSLNYPVLPHYEFSNFAKITSANFYDSDTTIINIQDLHNNKDVQDNIYKLLESLNKQYENLDIYIEGATDFIDYNKLSKVMNEKELTSLMNTLYENDKISGAEYFGYKNNKVLKPTEQKNIYETNIQNYSFLIKNRQKIKDLLFARYAKIKSLDTYLNPEQRKLLKYYNAYLDKKVSSEKFYDKLINELNKRKISILKYINIKLYIDVINASKKINQKLAERQLQTILTNLKSTISYQNYVNLIKDSNNLTDINVIFAYLSANISEKDKISKYPDLFNLISLREISSLINPLDLIEEEKEMVEDILLSYSKYVENKDVVFLNLFFQIYKKLLFAEISSREYEYYKKNYYSFSKTYSKYLSNDLFELFRYARVAEQFNELNIKRNLSFIDNISADITIDKNYNSYLRGNLYSINKIFTSLNKTKAVKVIVSGGFHTEGINELLDKNRISYITLTPNVKENDPLYEKKYLESIVEQAEVDRNAISIKPFWEQKILQLLSEGKTIEQVNKSISDIIKENNMNDKVSFSVDSKGRSLITINGNVFILNLDNNSTGSGVFTTLAKNIKALIREALKVKSIRVILGLKKEYDGTKGSGLIQEAEYYFMRHNILLPGFADFCLRAIVRDQDPDVSDRSNDNVYQMLLRVKNSFIGETFKCDIAVGRSKTLVGARPDGYGNTEEYGSLFYVVWEENADGVYVAKDILVSKILLDALKSFSEQQLKVFFTSLFVHERLEMLALTGQSEAFNQYVLENGLSKTSEVFHQYIQSNSFDSFLSEQGMDTEGSVAEEQSMLLNEMDGIISTVNEANSQYSNIISVSSLEKGKQEYDEKVLEYFLAIRTGEKRAIDDYNSILLEKVISQIEKEYLLTKKSTNPNFNIERDLNAENMEDFINFLNGYAIVYRKANNYITGKELTGEDFARSIKKALIKKYNIQPEKAKRIFISSFELQEDSQGAITLKNDKEIKGKKVFFIEDIISRQSETFNDVYNALKKYGADKVQGAVFFDLSKETEDSESITDSVYKQIIKGNLNIFDVITSVNGDIQKYFTYWLVKLSKDPNGQEILKNLLEQINSMDNDKQKQLVDNLMNSLMDMVRTNNFTRGVKCYDIINLILFIGFGEQKDVNSITKAEMDEFIEKYDFRVKDKKGNLALEVSYDDWKESIASLILYAYMLGYDYIDALKINNIVKTYGKNKAANKKIIDSLCREFNISFMDKKTKLKHTYETEDTEDLSEEIKKQKKNLEDARTLFKKEAEELSNKYALTKDHETYLAEMEKISAEYRTAIKEIMLSAKKIVLDKLASKKIKIDDNMFAIIIGGSLVKGNMMAESDIYYDIIVPDGIISKSIDKHFAPLYSSVLQEIGLTNYYVLKYSTTNMNRRNINTFVDEKDIAPFLKYSPLSDDKSKRNLFIEYRKKLIEDIKKKNNKLTIQQNLALITKKYFNISQKGKSWFGDSFYIAYDGKRSFSTRWTIMALESKLNEIIFKYIIDSDEEDIEIPVFVKDQLEFIRQHNILQKNVVDRIEFCWEYLSACRYVKKNNTWTDLSRTEQMTINEINQFVFSNQIANPVDTDSIKTIGNSDELLAKIEDFVYDNSSNIEQFRRGYDKYSHLETWKGYTSDKNRDIFVKAQVIDLLVEIDCPEIREKLAQTGIPKKDLDFIIESLDSIKLIDEKFPSYSSLKGERSLQNYWDAIATTAKNPETVFALIAHKLTKAQTSQNKEDRLLLYSIYLPLSKRFGNSDIYEYVRNDSFECSHPVEYLNLLNIISTLYGIPYSQLKENNENLKQVLIKYFEDKGLNMADIEIKIRVKSLYSIYEKLNSSRKKDNTEFKSLNKTERNAIKFVVNSDDIFFNLVEGIVKGINKKNITPKVIRKQILDCVDKDFKDLNDNEKNLLASVLAEMKNAIFADYTFVNKINGKLNDILTEYKKLRGSDDLVDIEKLKGILEAGGDKTALELWFVTLFEEQLKDLVGFHVVVKDESFPSVLDAVNNKTSNETYSGIKAFFAGRGIIFQKFYKDLKNKQARTKINASLKVTNGVPVPIEMCLYTVTDYENETYGLYNQKKISAPHYIYKMGKNIDLALFEHIFAKEADYSFIDSTDNEKKQMVYESDGFVPTDNLYENFEKIMNKLSGNITCFVEYEDGIYVQKLPKDANVFDLATTSKYFSDDINVAVYLETGDQITSDFQLDNARTYKIIKRFGCHVSVPSKETEAHTTRSKLIYHRLSDQNKADVSEFIESVGGVSVLTDFLNELLNNEDFRKLLDGRNMDYSAIAEEMLKTPSQNKILQDKDLIESSLSFLFDIMLSRDFENMLPSEFIRRSTQIANHYNLVNMFELFEAIEYGIIDFNKISSFYNMCFVIKTASNIEIDSIVNILRSNFTIKKVDLKESDYNLIINDEYFFIENIPIDEDGLQTLISLLNSEDLGLKVEHIVHKDDKRIETETDTIFVSVDFVQPKQEFPLMSLGNNIEALVKHAIVHHSELVKRILETTKVIANIDSYDIKDKETVFSLLEEYPVLMTQILLGLYSQEHYDEGGLLSQETPLLTQEEIDIIKENIQNPDFSEFSLLQQKYGVDLQREFNSKRISNVKFVVSRSLDLVEDMDTFSFVTMDVDSKGEATIYISEAFLKELDRREDKGYLLKQLALHEITEYLLLSAKDNLNYEDIHEQFEDIDGQRELLSFARSITPNVLRRKNALFQEVDLLLSPCDFKEMDSQSTVGFLLGSVMVSAFERTYKLYKQGKLSRIFISGSTRGTLGIIKNLMTNSENFRYINDIEQTQDVDKIRTIKDLLILAKKLNSFDALAPYISDSIQRDSSQLLLLDETLTTPISQDEIFEVVSKDGVSEAAIIKWIILESARQDPDNPMSRKEINQLIRSIVLETNASNTPENIANILAQKEFTDFVSDKEKINVVIIQTPFSQTRAGFTLNKFLAVNRENPVLKDKTFNIYNMNFDINYLFYHYRNVAALNLSLGEWARLIAYSLKGDIIPIVNLQEGLDSIRLEILANVLSLLPLLNDKEKEKLKKVFIGISGLSKEEGENDKEFMVRVLKVLQELLENYSKENKLDREKYVLIGQFIEYLCSDKEEQRELETEWEKTLPELISREEIIRDMSQMLQHKDNEENPFYKMLASA